MTVVEIIKKVGATVIATIGEPEELAISKQYGADHLIDYRTEDIWTRVKALNDGRGVEAVYGLVGSYVFNSIVAGNRTTRAEFVCRIYHRHWGAHQILDPHLISRSFDQLLSWYDAGELKPNISSTFDMADAPKAIEMLKSQKSTGSVVLRM